MEDQKTREELLEDFSVSLDIYKDSCRMSFSSRQDARAHLYSLFNEALNYKGNEKYE